MRLIIFLAISIICGAATAQASPLPRSHGETAAELTDDSASPCGFMAAALNASRRNSPFAKMPQLLQQSSVNPTQEARKVINYAQRFLGRKYILGATGPSAFDCSGFVGYVYRNFGVNLNRTSREQFLQGDKVSPSNLRPGDLLFFSSRSSGRGKVGHVAMVVSVDKTSGQCRFIHASTGRGVVYSTYPDNGYYERNFVGARRILGTSLAANFVSSPSTI